MKLSVALLLLAIRASLSHGSEAGGDKHLLRGSGASSAAPGDESSDVGWTPRELSLSGDIPSIPAPAGGRRLSGRVIMKPKDGLPPAAASRARAVIGRNKVVKESVGLGFSVVELSPGQEKQFIKSIEEGEDGTLFEYIEPDYIVDPTYTPNDQFLPQSWQHDAMRSRLAWDTTFGSQSVVVAICDTGLDMDHPDLLGNRVLGYNADTRTWGDAGASWTVSGSSHGTFCASCAAAIGNNGIGTIGSGGNLKHRPIQVSNLSLGGSAYSSTLAHCAEVACDQGDKVVNISYTGAEAASRRNAATYCRNRGSLVFNAAGNDNRDIVGYNADADNLIVVGATDSSDNKASFSAYGSLVDVMAPGASVVGAGVDTSTGAAGYYYISGTSFASPLTAGLAALIWSANPNLTADQVEQVIKESTDDLGTAGYDNTFAHGRINSHKAMQHPLVVNGLCESNADCSGMPDTPICDVAGGGQCVGCLSSADCAGSDLCDTSSNQCVGCLADSDCGTFCSGATCGADQQCSPGPAPCAADACFPERICNTSLDQCVDGAKVPGCCLANSDCSSSPLGPFCAPDNTCVQCLSTFDCPAPPACETRTCSTNLCGTSPIANCCASDVDCNVAGGEFCATTDTCASCSDYDSNSGCQTQPDNCSWSGKNKVCEPTGGGPSPTPPGPTCAASGEACADLPCCNGNCPGGKPSDRFCP